MAQHTRRQLLAGMGGLAATLAGCSTGPDSQPTATSAVGSGSHAGLADVQVTGSAVVATLPDEHDIQRVTLVGPDDETVASSSVDTDTATVELPILELDPQVAGYEHYTPGEHELVVATANDERTVQIPLAPALEIEAVQQYRSGDSPADLGRLAVTVVNTGTGPTWVYDIAFEGAPNIAANTDLSGEPGVPLVEATEGATPVPPSESKTYLSSTAPLKVSGEKFACSGRAASFQLEAGTPLSRTLRSSVSAEFRGNSKSAGISGDVVCTEATAELRDSP